MSGDVTLGQVLEAVQALDRKVENRTRTIREHLKRQDEILQGLAGNQKKMIDLLSKHSERLDALEEHVGI